MEKHKTSIYSQYEITQNPSLNSNQLQYWLKQIKSPNRNCNKQWTLMSNSSQNQSNQISFARIDTYQSCKEQKQNYSINSNRQTQRAKSYVNAMVALQKRTKTLQQQNSTMKISINQMKDIKLKVLNESRATQQQLKSRIQILQPRAQKLDQVLKQNNKLRDIKDEILRKSKLLEKHNKQLQEKLNAQIKKYQSAQEQKDRIQKQCKQYKTKCQQLEIVVKKIKQKNQILEQGRQKSTTSILQKYNKSVELNEELQRQNIKLQTQFSNFKKKTEQKLKFMEQKQQKQSTEMKLQNEKLLFENLKLNQQISLNKQQIQLMRDDVRKKDQEIFMYLKSQQKRNNSNNFKQQSSLIKLTDISRNSQNYKPTHPQKNYQCNKITEQIQSEIDMCLDQQENKYPLETKSVGKSVQMVKKSAKRSVLSSQEKKRKSFEQRVNQDTNDKLKSHVKIPHPKYKKNKSKRNDDSLILNSCEPAIKMRNSSFETSEKGFNSAQPHYRWTSRHPQQQVQQFCPMQQYNNNNDQNTVDKVLLFQVQKQAIRLYEQQQRMLNFSTQNCGPAERAEYVGRMKQLNEQIKINSERMFELKSK